MHRLPVAKAALLSRPSCLKSAPTAVARCHNRGHSEAEVSTAIEARGTSRAINGSAGGPAGSTASDTVGSRSASSMSAGTATLNPIPSAHPAPFYAEFPLDRMAGLRKSKTQLDEYFHSHPTSRLVLIQHGKCLVHTPPPPQFATFPTPPTQTSLVLLSPANKFNSHLLPDTLVFLGVDSQGAPYFAAHVNDEAVDALALQFPDAHWKSVRSTSARMNHHNAALAATASGLVHWHVNTSFSSPTGSPLHPSSGGHSRTDPTSGKSVYPRIDPAVITLVSSGPFCLLGHKPSWPEGRYSTLAGFLEVGENLEQAVAREVAEESGVKVDPSSIRYVTSQPWPFPQSLMVGFHAKAPAVDSFHVATTGTTFDPMSALSPSGRKAAIDTAMPADVIADTLAPELQAPTAEEHELEDVRWFHKSFIRAAARGLNQQLVAGFHFPGRHSLAHMLINQWLEAQAMPEWQGDSVPDVRIDSGVFKYVLMRLRDGAGNWKLLVWGDRRAAYHMNVFQSCKSACLGTGLQLEVYGGGRIEHNPEQQMIHVYGYSMAFGPAPHELSVAVLRRWYPFYPESQITMSYEGY